MTSLRDNILIPIGCQLADVYLPIIKEPHPSELRDLVVQLVTLEMRKRGSSTRPQAAPEFLTASEPSSVDPSIERWPVPRR
jgi:hypothetical protein